MPSATMSTRIRLGAWVVVLGAVVALGAVIMLGRRSSWPEEATVTFKHSCLSSARSANQTASDAALMAFCACALAKMQARFTYEEMAKLEALMLAAPTAAPTADPAFRAAFAECLPH